jgi:hypothetical protein
MSPYDEGILIYGWAIEKMGLIYAYLYSESIRLYQGLEQHLYLDILVS